ncbi:hypothetical protein [Gordonia neofelifaecis]|uniref:Uncharacterized protein n=1 Tax=Gordonia neofelifaecis NRRL B-59395 TaxID=644548 RepID=F1YEC2_9ACTN|nr:hypothetical protein [Gordonia neofelifaecis]EGD56755.1 hypothetical protein SCNU_00215 [Gordonia neofelifaecis NRRL B-59395]
MSGRSAAKEVLPGSAVGHVPDAIAVLSEHRLHHFDVRGVTRIFELALDDSGRSMLRRGDDVWQRATSRFVDDDTIEGTAGPSYDGGGTWQHAANARLKSDMGAAWTSCRAGGRS